MLAYDGPILKIDNASNGQEVRAVMSLAQQINIEKDENSKCANYPNEHYQSYKDCDQLFVFEFFQDRNITPFWATKKLETVTNKRQE